MISKQWSCARNIQQPNHASITLSSDWKKIHGEKQNNFVISLFILAKVAAKWQLLSLLFWKGKGENKSQICDFSRYFSPKGKKFSCKCDCIGCNFKPCQVISDKDSYYEQ